MVDCNIPSFRDTALAYAAAGIYVMPLHGVNPGPDGALQCRCPEGAECRSPGKHPIQKGWRTRATINPHVVRRIQDRFPKANLGLMTGRKSKLVVLDYDPRHGSEAERQRLVNEHGPLPATPTVRTGSGGHHEYYLWPADRVVGNSLPALRDVDGIDVRGEGGLVVAPPSLHVSGRRYEWETGLDVPLAPLPSWMLVGTTLDARAESPPDGIGPYAWAAISGESQRVLDAEDLSRNDTLFQAACRLGELIAGGGPTREVCEGYLCEAAREVGVGRKEALWTIGSGFRAGAKNPRVIPARSLDWETAQQWLANFRVLFHSLPWSGRRGKTCHLVLEALTRLGMRYGRKSGIPAALSTLSIEAGIASISGVRNGLRDLVADGWLSCSWETDGLYSSQWTLCIPPQHSFPGPDGEVLLLDQDLTSCSKKEVVVVMEQEGEEARHLEVLPALGHPLVPYGHDAFRDCRGEWKVWDPELDDYRVVGFREQGGLQHRAARVLEWLLAKQEADPTSDFTTQADIARGTGLHRSTVGRAVNDLIEVKVGLKRVEVGLVEKDDTGSVRAVPVDIERLDALAQQLGTAGRSRSQREECEWPFEAELPEARVCPNPERCCGLESPPGDTDDLTA